MATIGEILSFENPLLKTYAFYGSVLALKMLGMSVLTSRMRFRKLAVANPEDLPLGKGKAQIRVDDDVERIRRAHQNDLENIPVFLCVSGLYLLTNPSVGATTMLFRAFTAVRIVHTLVYAVWVVPQPARGLSWGIGYGITIYMAVTGLLAFKSGL